MDAELFSLKKLNVFFTFIVDCTKYILLGIPNNLLAWVSKHTKRITHIYQHHLRIEWTTICTNTNKHTYTTTTEKKRTEWTQTCSAPQFKRIVKKLHQTNFNSALVQWNVFSLNHRSSTHLMFLFEWKYKVLPKFCYSWFLFLYCLYCRTCTSFLCSCFHLFFFRSNFFSMWIETMLETCS